MQDMNRINELKNYNINIDELVNSCNNALEKQLFDVVFGDKNVIRMSQSPSMRQLFKYMEGRINLNKDNKSDYLDYNYPRFVIYSAHDTSIAGVEKLMNLVFGCRLINPLYAANLYFELHFENNKYKVKYIMNDDVIQEFDYFTFKNEIEKYLWSEKEIEDFCQFSYKKMNSEENYYYTYEKILYYLIVIMILSILCLLIGIFYIKCKINSIKNKKNNFDFVESE